LLFQVEFDSMILLNVSDEYSYCSAGSFEDWRPDKNRFPDSVKGKPLDGWLVYIIFL